jgi:hypothetical protein
VHQHQHCLVHLQLSCTCVVCCDRCLQDLAHLDQRHVNLIKLLMHGSKEPEKQYSTAPWLFDVVSLQTKQHGWINTRV